MKVLIDQLRACTNHHELRNFAYIYDLDFDDYESMDIIKLDLLYQLNEREVYIYEAIG